MLTVSDSQGVETGHVPAFSEEEKLGGRGHEDTPYDQKEIVFVQWEDCHSTIDTGAVQ